MYYFFRFKLLWAVHKECAKLINFAQFSKFNFQTIEKRPQKREVEPRYEGERWWKPHHGDRPQEVAKKGGDKEKFGSVGIF